MGFLVTVILAATTLPQHFAFWTVAGLLLLHENCNKMFSSPWINNHCPLLCSRLVSFTLLHHTFKNNDTNGHGQFSSGTGNKILLMSFGYALIHLACTEFSFNYNVTPLAVLSVNIIIKERIAIFRNIWRVNSAGNFIKFHWPCFNIDGFDNTSVWTIYRASKASKNQEG